MPKKLNPPENFDEVVFRYKNNQKMSIRDVANELCVSNGTVKRWFAIFNVEQKLVKDILSAKRNGLPSARKGVKLSTETKKKISAACMGNQKTLGYKFSEASKEKMRMAAVRRCNNTDSVLKMQLGRKKNYLSAEERLVRTKTRDACKRMLRRILTMARIRKDATTEAMLGYSKKELREHLEKQFTDGMSWLDRNSFHIDHIKPVAVFFKEGINDPKVINALSNLQVLTPQENRAKASKYASI